MSIPTTTSVVQVPLTFTDSRGLKQNVNLSIDLSDAKAACPSLISTALGRRFDLSSSQVSAIRLAVQNAYQQHAIIIMQARGVALPPLASPCHDILAGSSSAAAAAAMGKVVDPTSSGTAGPALQRPADAAALVAPLGKSLLSTLAKRPGRRPKSVSMVAGTATAAVAASSASADTRASKETGTDTAGADQASSTSSAAAAGAANGSPARKTSSPPPVARKSPAGAAAGADAAAPGSVPAKRKRERERERERAEDAPSAAQSSSDAALGPDKSRRGRKSAADSSSSSSALFRADAVDAAAGASAAAGIDAGVGDAGGGAPAPAAKRARTARAPKFGDEEAEALRVRGKGKQASSSVSSSGKDGGSGEGDGGKAQSRGKSSRKSNGKRKERQRRRSGAAAGAGAGPAADENDNGSEAEEEDVNEDGNVDYCHHCRKAGDLVCCDRCPRSYHPPCMGISLDSLPDGAWLCPLCVEQLGANREKEGKTSSKLCSSYFDGPFDGPSAKYADDRRRELAEITAALLSHEFAAPFSTPVPESMREAGYFDLIKRPIDLGTVASKIESGAYTAAGIGGESFDAVRCVADLRLIFNNCIVFNRAMSCIWRMGEAMHFALETALRDRVSLSEDEAGKLRRLREVELKRIPRPVIDGGPD